LRDRDSLSGRAGGEGVFHLVHSFGEVSQRRVTTALINNYLVWPEPPFLDFDRIRARRVASSGVLSLRAGGGLG
jgi:hypothetical protein